MSVKPRRRRPSPFQVGRRMVRDAAMRRGVGPIAWAGAAGVLCLLALAGQHEARPVVLPTFALSEGAMRAIDAQLTREVEGAPADSAGFLRQAYAAGLAPGRLTPAGVQALRRSYALEPLGPDATYWRLAFCFDHWSSLPPDVKARAATELAAAYPRHGWAMRGIPDAVSDPSGRLAAALMFQRNQAALQSRS